MSNNQAIVIGINSYEFLQPLKFAKQDAENLKALLEKNDRFSRVFLFTDDSPSIKGSRSTRPFRSNLLRFLNQLSNRFPMENKDDLWFFFSGHGVRCGSCDYLMPLDGDPDNIENTAVSMHDVIESLQRCGAGNIVLMLDACRNQGGKDTEVYGAETELIARQKGLISFFSCSPSQYSYEPASLKSGIFTKALIDGLGEKGQCSTVHKLDQYLISRISNLVEEYCTGAEQTPYTIAEPISKTHFILMPEYVSAMDLSSLKNDAYSAEFADDWALAEVLWLRILEISSGSDMDAVKGIKRSGIHQADSMLYLDLLKKAIELPLTENVDSEITQSLLEVISTALLGSFFSQEPTLFLHFTKKILGRLLPSEGGSQIVTQEMIGRLNKAISKMAVSGSEIARTEHNVVILGPRASGKQIYLIALLHFLETSKLNCTFLNKETEKFYEDKKFLLSCCLNLEASSSGLSNPTISVSLGLKNLQYRQNLFHSSAYAVLSKEVLIEVEKSHSFFMRLLCGEFFDLLFSDEHPPERKSTREAVQNTGADCFCDSDILFLIDSHSTKADIKYSKRLSQAQKYWRQHSRLQRTRVAVVFSMCETNSTREALDDVHSLLKSSFPETRKVMESWNQVPNVEIEYFSCSAFGFSHEDQKTPNVEYVSEHWGVLKDPRYWQPVGVFEPILWLATGQKAL